MAYLYVMHPGNRLRQIRMEARPRITQTALADAIGKSQEAISQYENGKRPLDLDVLRALARALNCTVADILDDRDHPDRLTCSERELMEAFRAVGETEREFLLTSARAVAAHKSAQRKAG